MAYTRVYENRITWENYPSVNTPIDEINLNKMDYALNQIDGTLANWDTTKAEQSDMLLAVKTIVFNDSNGQITITFFNGTSTVIDTLLEKIAVNFDFDDDPTSAHYQSLIITLDDGTVKYVDMSSLITQYEFIDSSTMHFTIGQDGSISVSIIDGSVTEAKLQPNFLADCRAEKTAAQTARTGAETAESNAEDSAEDAEAWAVGQRNGQDVPSTDNTYNNNSKHYSNISKNNSEDSEAWAVGTRGGVDVHSTDPAYHNNAKWWSEHAQQGTFANLLDVDLNNLQDGQVPKWDATNQKWKNGDAGGGTLASLTDTNITSLSNNDLLVYNSTSQKWKNGKISLSNLNDIRLSSPIAVNSYLGRNSDGYWENMTLPMASTTTMGMVKFGSGLDFPTLVRNLYNGDVMGQVELNYVSNPIPFTELPAIRIKATTASITKAIVIPDTGVSRTYNYSPNVSEVILDSSSSDFSGASKWGIIRVYGGSASTPMPLDVSGYTSATTFTDSLSTFDRWSPVVSCLVGATSVTFDDIAYNDSWCYDLYCDDGTGKEIPKESIIVNTSTDNSVTVTFKSALANATQCKLHYWKV